MKYTHIRSLLIALLILGQGQAGMAAPIVVPNLKNPILKKKIVPKTAMSVRKPPARLVGKALKSSVSPQIGFTILPANSSLYALSKDNNWALGNLNGYPAIFDLAGNPTLMTNLTTPSEVFTPNSDHAITGMSHDGTLCGNLKGSGTGSSLVPFYATSSTTGGTVTFGAPTVIPGFNTSSGSGGTAMDISASTNCICGASEESAAAYLYTVGDSTSTIIGGTSANAISWDGRILTGENSGTGANWVINETGVIGPLHMANPTNITGASSGPQMALSANGFRSVGKDSNNQAMSSSLAYGLAMSGTTYTSSEIACYPPFASSTGLAASAGSNLWGGSSNTGGFLSTGTNGCFSVENWLFLKGVSASIPSGLPGITSVNGINAEGTLVIGNIGSGANKQGFLAYVGGSGGGGTPGPMGPAGAKGDTGPQGPTGLTGATGAKGDKGDTGIQGPAGTPGGPAGPTGATGARGLQGIRGLQGVPGTQGQTGSQGIQGYTGPQGVQGPKGDAGPQGPAGNPAVGLEKEDIVSKGSRSRLPQQD